MVIAPLSLQKDYWESFELTDQDLEFLYNYLFEAEKSLTLDDLMKALIKERIRQEKELLEKKQTAGGSVYYPKDHYQAGQSVNFPHLEWQTGRVVSVRSGHNPELPPFEVIEVEMENGETHMLAAGLEEHALNKPVEIDASDPLLDSVHVFNTYGEELAAQLGEYLDASPDLVRVAARYFPRALLVDINIGHLNLAEAVLDMMGGGPMGTPELMEQIDLPTDVDSNLNEFSLNLALHEDKRFDEVGPSGEVLWYLHRLEPEPVREAPLFLKYTGVQESDPVIAEMLCEFDQQVIDELETNLCPPSEGKSQSEVTFNLIYPHWRAGTLPLAGGLVNLFPTAIESPRIQFFFIDGLTGEKFPGWVVRPYQYIYGLRDWYLAQGLIAGSILHLERSKNPGEVIIRAEKKRPTREWLRTAIIGSDGGVVFSMLKHNITAAVDERMAIVISDTDMLDKIWERSSKQRPSLTSTVRLIINEMAKLSPQNHVHAQELYAGVNILRRCPPGPILSLLNESPWAKHLGNLYFRLDDSSGGDND